MNETTAETNLIKKTELKKLLGVSNRTVDNWVAQWLIPYLAITPRLHLFDLTAVKSALSARFAVDARGS